MENVELFANAAALMVAGIDEHVKYTCSCSKLRNLSRLYFCRYCIKLRCSECVSHEVDSYFCPNCLENMPSAEAKSKKNRCATCFDCPSCSNTLSIRIASMSVIPQSPDAKAGGTKKMHYLSCGFCRWTSRDVGLPDQSSVSGSWPEPESSFSKQMTQLVDYYKQVTHQERLERDKRKLPRRKSYSHLSEKFSLALTLSKKRTISSSSPLVAAMLNKGEPLELIPAPAICEATDEIEPLYKEYYTDIIDVDKVLGIDQRLAHIESQPEFCKQLYPRHKKLSVRRSQRCRECEHNLSKPEFNPSVIKFKIHLGALQYIPQIKLVSVPTLELNQESDIVLSVTNPLEVVVTVNFIRVDPEDADGKDITAELTLPTVSIPVATGDGMSEFEDVEATPNTDDPSVVKSRAANKVLFYAKVKPLTDDSILKAVFRISYSHKAPNQNVPLVTPAAKKEEQTEKKPEDDTLISHDFQIHLLFNRNLNTTDKNDPALSTLV